MEDNEYGGGPEPKEQQEQEEQGELVVTAIDLTDTQLAFSSQLENRRRKTGEMTEAGGRKVPEVSEAEEVGADLEDEE